MRQKLGCLPAAAALLTSCAATAFAFAPGLITLVPNGAVDVRSGPAASWDPVTGPQAVTAGQEVRTHRESTAELRFADGSRVEINNFSIFAIDKTSSDETGFSLKLGKIRAAFAGLLSSHVNIRTPTAVCAVRGTVFDLSADEKGTEVAMAEGVLEVKDKQGKQAVVTSEETMRIGENGLEKPRMLSLSDKRSLPAVRSYAVHQDMAREAARKSLEDNRNRELKASVAQLGKDVIDAFGQRVRLEEYLVRPNSSSFEVLFLNSRANSFNWGHLVENFNAPIPTDLSQVPAIINAGLLSANQPANYLKSFEFYATNTIDADKEDIVFGAPTQINFAGFNKGNPLLLWYPSTVDFTQTLSGPGVPGGSRVQFQQLQDYNVSNPGQFTWVQAVQATAGANNLQPILAVAMDPANPVSAQSGGTIFLGGPCTSNCTASQVLYNETVANTLLPYGPNKADLLETTTYPDGSSVSVDKFLVSNNGQLFDFNNTASALFNVNDDYNLEVNIKSNMFSDRAIDVLIAPEILKQKQTDAPGPGALQP